MAYESLDIDRLNKGQLDMFEPCPHLRFEVLADHAVRLCDRRMNAAKRQPVTIETVNARSAEGILRRREIAREIVNNAGSMSDFARRLGIGSSTACKWLRNHAPDLHEELLDQPHPIVIPSHERLARLLAVKAGLDAGLTQPAVARRLGLAKEVLRNWLKTWAPDGLDDAIELESVDVEDEAYSAWETIAA